MKPMRILAFFLSSCEYGKYLGGAERRFLEISSILQKLGVKMFVLEYKPSLSETWGDSGYHSINISQRFIDHAILETVRMIIKGIKTCAENKCNVVYVPNRHCYGHNNLVNVIPAYVVSLIFRKPLVIVFHHLMPTDPGDRNIIRLAAYRHAKACIAVSQATADDFRKAFGLSRLVVSSNGVNLANFRNIESMAKVYDAVFFGRMSEEKGVFTLLKAWKILIKQMPSAHLLLLGGVESEHMKESCVRVIESLGLSQNVTISGFVSDKEAVRLLKSSRIFVLPSTAEGFGLVVVEAMAAGLPCILSNLPALKENFHSTAVFVEPKDVKRLAKAILGLLLDPENCRKLAEKGQKLVERFSWETVAKKELNILQRVVES
ncbi:MAG: glycosyltransferase family 4 protein [Candidatus Bathyarchaeota archaeon]|nr:glycosyltransferase family 4 protein [Candidatus Bathyarchaeota archaeon]MDH5787847.1 glycosyltransferase family 4 protein [Candidatus Bathyarchaeota archaeon]